MRTFSAFEKKIINKLLTLDKDNSNSICVQNILVDESGIIGKPTEFEFGIGGAKKLSIYYYKDIDKLDENEKELLHNLEKQLFDFVLIMNYLIDENYILRIPKNLHSNPHKKVDYKREIQLNSKLANMLGELWDNEFIIRPELKLLKKHKYKELNLYNEHINNLWTRWIAIFSILFSIGFNLITFYITRNENRKTSIDINNTSNNEIPEESFYNMVKIQSLTEDKEK